MITKPPLPRLDRSYHLARGVVACWGMHEGAGGNVNDLVAGNNGTLDAGAVWATTGGGWGVDVSADGIAVNPAVNGASNALTVFAFVTLGPVPFGTGHDNYLYDQQTDRIIVWLTTLDIKLYINGSQPAVAHGLSGGDSATLVLTATQTPDLRNIWVNERHVMVDDSTAFTDWGASSGAARIGERYSGDSSKFDGVVHLLGVADRAWTPNEAIQFHTDPFAMLRPRRNVFKAPAGGGGGVANPWYQYQQQLAGAA